MYLLVPGSLLTWLAGRVVLNDPPPAYPALFDIL